MEGLSADGLEDAGAVGDDVAAGGDRSGDAERAIVDGRGAGVGGGVGDRHGACAGLGEVARATDDAREGGAGVVVAGVERAVAEVNVARADKRSDGQGVIAVAEQRVGHVELSADRERLALVGECDTDREAGPATALIVADRDVVQAGGKAGRTATDGLALAAVVVEDGDAVDPDDRAIVATGLEVVITGRGRVELTGELDNEGVGAVGKRDERGRQGGVLTVAEEVEVIDGDFAARGGGLDGDRVLAADEVVEVLEAGELGGHVGVDRVRVRIDVGVGCEEELGEQALLDAADREGGSGRDVDGAGAEAGAGADEVAGGDISAAGVGAVAHHGERALAGLGDAAGAGHAAGEGDVVAVGVENTLIGGGGGKGHREIDVERGGGRPQGRRTEREAGGAVSAAEDRRVERATGEVVCACTIDADDDSTHHVALVDAVVGGDVDGATGLVDGADA